MIVPTENSTVLRWGPNKIAHEPTRAVFAQYCKQYVLPRHQFAKSKVTQRQHSHKNTTPHRLENIEGLLMTRPPPMCNINGLTRKLHD